MYDRIFYSVISKSNPHSTHIIFLSNCFDDFFCAFSSLFFTFRVLELDERMRDLKTELQSLEGDAHDEVHQRKAMEALKRMESWNLFSDEHEVFTIPSWFEYSFSKGIGIIILRFL